MTQKNLMFVLIFEPQVVGKITVGQELAKITDVKLFHNHMVTTQLYKFLRMQQ